MATEDARQRLPMATAALQAATKATNATTPSVKSDAGSDAGLDWLACHARHAKKSTNAESPMANAAAAQGLTVRASRARGADQRPQAGMAGLAEALSARNQNNSPAGSPEPSANIRAQKPERDRRPLASPGDEKWLTTDSGNLKESQHTNTAPAAMAASETALGRRSASIEAFERDWLRASRRLRVP